MGSTSVSQSSSTTAYSNTPVTQEDVQNPFNQFLNLSNVSSGTKINSNETTNSFNLGGGSINLSDAGAISAAFDFGSKAVQIVADLTIAKNAAKEQGAQDSTKEAATGDGKAEAFDWTKYKTELMLGAGILAFWWWGRKK